METVACPDCDLLQHIPALPSGGKARCPRCGWVVATRTADPLDRPLALTLTALIVLIIANTAPLMGLSAVGRHASTTIIGGAYEMWVQGQQMTAVIVTFCAVIAPAGYLLFMLTVLLAVRRPPAPHWVGEMLRWADSMRPWSMNEVMLLGILVALIKIAELGDGGSWHRHVCVGWAGGAVSRYHGHVRSGRNLAARQVGGRRRSGAEAMVNLNEMCRKYLCPPFDFAPLRSGRTV